MSTTTFKQLQRILFRPTTYFIRNRKLLYINLSTLSNDNRLYTDLILLSNLAVFLRIFAAINYHLQLL